MTDDPGPDGPVADDAPADGGSADGPVLLFDGVCDLCNGAVRFVIRRDPAGTFRFAPLQSDAGRDLLARCGGPATARPPGNAGADDPGTVVLVEDGRCFVKSEAALRVAGRLGLPYSALSALRVVPRPLRDAVYDLVADRRYRWFGRRDECMVPSPEVESRFLD